MRKVAFAHSPDPDDAFMAWPLATRRVSDSALDLEVEARDIATLNAEAIAGVGPDVSALSAATFLSVADRYVLLRHGASFGEGYGPVLVAPRGAPREGTVAVPGETTTAFLVLKLAWPGLRHLVVPFDQVMAAARAGDADLALVIHEGQVTFEREGFEKVLDLGAWWRDETGLPLPLGVLAAKRELGDALPRVSSLLRRALDDALANREQALAYAARFARGLDLDATDRFVRMYVNARTLDMGAEGVEAIRVLARRGAAAGLLPAGSDRFRAENEPGSRGATSR